MATVNTASAQNALCIEVQARFQGVLRQVLQLSPVRSLFIGDALGCDLFVAPSELGAEKFPLILVKDGKAYFCMNATMRERSASLSAVSAVESEGLFMVEIKGSTGYEVSFESGISFSIKASEKVAAPARKGKLDAALLGYTGGSVVMHSLIMGLIFSISPEAKSLQLTEYHSKNDIASVAVSAPEIKEEIVPVAKKEGHGSLTNKKTPAHIGVTTPREKKGGIGTSVRKDITSDVLQPAGVKTIATNVGIVSLIQGGAFQGSVASSALAEGPENFFGDDLGERPGDDFGNPFGTFKGEGDEQAGNKLIQDIGEPGGKKRNTSLTSFCTTCDTHDVKGPEDVTMGKAEPFEGLDKDAVRRVIKRAMPGIKFCYEQGLQQNNDLGGKVRVKFVVAPNGSVADSRAVEGIDAKVDSCVASKIAQLSFPMPANGSVVEITYPFMFQSASK
jgi:hypothetical protein